MPMILCAAGDIHGALDRFYGDVLAFEAALGVRFECVWTVAAWEAYSRWHKQDPTLPRYAIHARDVAPADAALLAIAN